ncbi:MAG: hypothetical protein M1826_005695 [Phylliscum demangeonii]|nr:MAG: hypothetical protein M1826_005695 [Phylliscum demangeonii]
MPVELRKRKTPATTDAAPAPPAKKGTTSTRSTATAAAAAAAAPKEKSTSKKSSGKATAINGAETAAGATKLSIGDVIALDGFGGEVETEDGEKTTLKALVDASEAGVVLFTYPKASTPSCTTQACLFRDAYPALTATGLAIYGLSADSSKANAAFKTKQKLPYALLCDSRRTLIAALGYKKTAKATTRAVVVFDKSGKVLAAEAGGPAVTLAVVHKLVGGDVPATEAVAEAADDADVLKPDVEVEPPAQKDEAEKEDDGGDDGDEGDATEAGPDAEDSPVKDDD